MRTGRLWADVWHSSRVQIARAVAREWGGCYGEDQDPPGERACVRGRVRGYNPKVATGARTRAYNTHVF
jgi:hypothetical protein